MSDAQLRTVDFQPPPPPPSPSPAAIPEEAPAAIRTPEGNPGRAPITVGRTGRVSMHMDNLEIRQALDLLSRQATLNILVSPGVQGSITVNLDGVTVDQALDAILKLGNLSADRQGNLIFVETPEEILQQGDRGALVTRVYHLNYIQPNDIESMIRPFISQAGKLTTTPPPDAGISGGTNLFGGFGAFGGAGGSSGGGGGGGGGGGAAGRSITGGNSLAGGDVVIVQDFEANVRTIDEIIKRLDVQPMQVLVEAVILSVEVDRGTNLGINFGILNKDGGQGLGIVGNGAELSNNAGFRPANVINNATGKILGDAGAGFLAPTNGFKYGFVDNRVTAFVRALESIGQINVLASPRVLVLNKQRAEIQLGQRLGYSTVTQNLTSTVQQIQFLNTGTLLRFRPYVSSDGMIRMEVHPEKSTGNVSQVTGIPSSNTSEVTTNVMVPDGATIVIGGLIENTDDSEQAGVLGLSRLPVVGGLFRQKQQTSTKRELIVLLTPRIWNPNGQVGPPPHLDPTCPPPPIIGLATSAAPESRPGSENIPSVNAPRASRVQALARITPLPDRPSTAPAPAPAPPQYAARTNITPAPPPASPLPAAPANGPFTTPKPPADPSLPPLPPHLSRYSRVRRDPALLRASAEIVEEAGDDRSLPMVNPAQQPVVDPGYPLHLVRRGENFWTISQRYYGSGRYYQALWSLNRSVVDAPDRLAVGMAIAIPPISDLDPSLVSSALPTFSETSARVESGSTAPKQDDRVQRAWMPVKSSPAAPRAEPKAP